MAQGKKDDAKKEVIKASGEYDEVVGKLMNEVNSSDNAAWKTTVLQRIKQLTPW